MGQKIPTPIFGIYVPTVGRMSRRPALGPIDQLIRGDAYMDGISRVESGRLHGCRR